MNIGATNPALATIQVQTQTTALSQSDQLATSRSSSPLQPASSSPAPSNSTSANTVSSTNSADQLVARNNDPLQPSQIQPSGGNRTSSAPGAGSNSSSAPSASQSAASISTAVTQPPPPPVSKQPTPVQQDPQVQAQVRQLSKIDREVRDHEAAHAAAGGALAGAPSFSYTRGPDGQLYATGGEVSIDTSAAVDPAATAANARTVIQAALAPANPSTQDLRVAAQARAQLIDAQAELTRNAQQALEEERVVASANSESVTVDLESDQAQSDSALNQALESERGTEEEAKASEEKSEDEQSQQQSGNSFQENRAVIAEREARIRQSQLEFSQELAQLNQRIQLVQQQLIETGEVNPASLLQGFLLDTQA